MAANKSLQSSNASPATARARTSATKQKSEKTATASSLRNKASAPRPSKRRPSAPRAAAHNQSSNAEPKHNGIGDAAVVKATGHGWDYWFKLLDKAGAASWTHAHIVGALNEEHGVPEWWCQMLTVGYEQARGLRVKHEKPEGFEISVSKTIDVPIKAAFEACVDEEARTRWLPEQPLVIRKATEPKTVRATWIDGRTHVTLGLYVKGPEKCQVVAQHAKISDAAAAEKLKALWAKRLLALKMLLEG